MPNALKLSAASLATLLLSACAPSAATHIAATDSSVKSFRPIAASCKDTPATRKAIAEHNSVYDTLLKGTEIVYKDGCPVDIKPKPKKNPVETVKS